MSFTSDLKTYENVLVSGVEHNFSLHDHAKVPRALVADWASLMTRLTRVIHPGFAPPPVPEVLVFQEETIHSDGPYPADENYYTLDYVYLTLLGAAGSGLSLNVERCRRDGGDPICLNTVKLHPQTSSHIWRDATEPRASIFLFHDSDKTPEVQAIIAQHTAECVAKRPARP